MQVTHGFKIVVASHGRLGMKRKASHKKQQRTCGQVRAIIADKLKKQAPLLKQDSYKMAP